MSIHFHCANKSNQSPQPPWNNIKFTSMDWVVVRGQVKVIPSDHLINKNRNDLIHINRYPVPTLTGLEPARDGPNWFLINRVNHSAIVSIDFLLHEVPLRYGAHNIVIRVKATTCRLGLTIIVTHIMKK